MGIQHPHNHDRRDGSCSGCPPPSVLASMYRPWTDLSLGLLHDGQTPLDVAGLLETIGIPDTALRVALWKFHWRDTSNYVQAIHLLNAVRPRRLTTWVPRVSMGALVYDPRKQVLIERSALAETLLRP